MAEQTTAATRAQESVGIRDLLKIRNFRFLWLGQIVSDFGDSLTMLTLLIMINQLTSSPAAIAGMMVALTLPHLTFGLIAGVYVDRLDRKRIMLASDLLRGLLVLGFIFVGSADTLWLLYVIAFVQASIGTFFTPARSALLPNIVPMQSLLAANSITQTSRVIFNLLGTAAAGLLAGMFDAFWPAFAIDALTFFVSFALISRVAAQTRGEAHAGKGTPRAIFGQLSDGMKVIAGSRLLTGTLIAVAVTMLGFGAVNVLMVPFILNDLKLPTTWFGVVEFAQTVSMVLSGSLVAVLASRLRPTNIVSLSVVILGILIAVVSVVTNIWQLLIILFAVGWVMTPMQASLATIMQTAVDNSLRGRVGASLNTIISTASLLSMALAGIFGQLIGVRNVFVLGGIMALTAGLASAWLYRSTRVAPVPVETPERPSADNLSMPTEAA
jgi:MFS transporter, DHA3 family, macrolide efflux protein